ncbi:sumo ligase, putative [Entamoeba invadens IP1]|uniref:Sumo ligase, putative n=1 Tax=Entamoeba invadens IP1 TaxID=370355 RepID=A0A0A1UG17_ENTIV|nr:sumo ligase, putative [Entamoeba invadens IP1]ELP94340.1 sumo ligase, putative [Entamoeba invadens IP1]|eukprot:XP_004261111.1 sumo ligase, putative [Entamoeba invadens IP1]
MKSTPKLKLKPEDIGFIIAPTFHVKSINLNESLIQRTSKCYALSINITFPPFDYDSYDIHQSKVLRYKQLYESTTRKHRMQVLIVDKSLHVIHPSSVGLKINGYTTLTDVFGKIPTRGTPFIEGIDITDYLVKGNNVVTVETSYPDTYCVIYEGIAMTITQTMQRILRTLPKEYYSQPLDIDLNNNNEDEEEDVVEEQQVLSLRCPISFTRIKIPVRGKRCTHQRTFDLKSFLQTAQKAGYYSCPLCSESIQPIDLVIDLQMEHIIKDLTGQPDIEEVIVLPDGKVKPKEAEKLESDDDDEEKKLLEKGRERRTKRDEEMKSTYGTNYGTFNTSHPQQNFEEGGYNPFYQYGVPVPYGQQINITNTQQYFLPTQYQLPPYQRYQDNLPPLSPPQQQSLPPGRYEQFNDGRYSIPNGISPQRMYQRFPLNNLTQQNVVNTQTPQNVPSDRHVNRRLLILPQQRTTQTQTTTRTRTNTQVELNGIGSKESPICL